MFLLFLLLLWASLFVEVIGFMVATVVMAPVDTPWPCRHEVTGSRVSVMYWKAGETAFLTPKLLNWSTSLRGGPVMQYCPHSHCVQSGSAEAEQR